MRKIYSLLALLFVVAMGASAQKLYDAVGFGDDGQLTAITPGQTVVMKSAAATDAVFLNITDRDVVRIQDVINDYSLFQFEVATDTTYYLKSVATGKYLEDPLTANNVVRLTANKVRAAQLAVRNPYVYNNAAEVDTARKYNEEEYSYLTFTTDEIFGMEEYSWKLTAVTATGYRMFSTNATWNQYYNRNTWEFYLVQEKSSLESLIALLNEYCGEQEEAALDIFIPGSDPGQVDEPLVEEVHAAYLELVNLVNESSEDDTANWAAYNRFLAAYQACQNGIKPMRGGYFYFTNWRTESSGEWGDVKEEIPDNAVYEDETKHETYWSFKNGWVKPDAPQPEDAKYIYLIIDNGDGTFYLQNYKTKRYLGYVSGNNKRIPTTENPEEKIRITIHPTLPGYFSVISTSRENGTGNDVAYPAMHASGDYNAIVYWTPQAPASGWKFREIPESDIIALENMMAQYQRNIDLQELLGEAQATYNKGFSYTSVAERNSDYNEPGLVTDAEQLWTNAEEPKEGALADLLDSYFTTFFHSRWSDLNNFETADGGQFHNIVADLTQAVSAVDVKITKRMGDGEPSNYLNNAPYKVHFYTTNNIDISYDDETAAPIWTSNDWHDQGVVMFSYPYSAYLEGDETEYKNETGINSCAFDGEYRYVRMDVESRGNGATGWFNMSEIRYYEAKYDPTTSIIEAVPADKRTALEEAMAVAKNELLDEAATQETMDRLQAAYDAFVSAYPDPQRVLNLLEELRAQRDAAEEGTGLGYFEEGAKDELNTAITTVEANVKDVMSVQEVNAALETLNAAYAVFNSKLHMPADGSYLMIRSATASEDAGSAANNYLYAVGHGNSQIHWGGYSKSTGYDTNIRSRLNYIWRADKNEDGSYRFFNLATGRYMACQPLNNKAMTMAIDEENVDMNLRSAKVGGMFNIVQADGVFANAQPGGNHVLVTWNSASGTDNSAFQFEPADWDGTYYFDQISTTTMTPLTLPFEVSVPYADEATVYSVVGYKGDAEAGYKLILKAYAEDATIPAATPFVVKMANENSGMVFFIEGANSLDQISYTLTPKSENGFNGTIDPVTLEPNCGFFSYGRVLLSEKDAVCPANSGYLTNIVPTEEDGDAQVVLESVPATGIFVISTERNANNVIFDLQGRRVINAQKGLYIINGKKVLVK